MSIVSVSRFAGLPAIGTRSVDEAFVQRQWGVACRQELGVLGQQDRKVGLRYWRLSALFTVHNRNRSSPVALATD